METAKHIASGDLGRRLEVGANDEMGQLQQAVKMMQARLQTVIGRIAEFSGTLASDAQQVSSVAEQSNQGIFQQQNEIDMVATAMNEMASAVQEVARHAAEAAEAARHADEEAHSGKAVVGSVIQTIEQLDTEVERAREVIHQLEAKSESIGSILDVITGIADQTNLLALNAAIEAARAGESRGGALPWSPMRCAPWPSGPRPPPPRSAI